MMELRKDYILDRWVIISEERAKRPQQFLEASEETDLQVCYFCPGNENMTPPEKGHMGEPWKIRWFNNKFQAVKPQGNPTIRTDNSFFTFSDAYGVHEVLVETNVHTKQLWDFSKEEIAEILEVYNNRIEELENIPNIDYVCVFKNHGKNAGTSIVHSHSQIIALNKVPPEVQIKYEASKNFGDCPYCRILNIEKESFRRCFENDSFVAFTPYASRFHYEIWIFPKQHKTRLTQFTKLDYLACADILQKILLKLKSLNAPYNLELIHSPKGRPLHLHFQITPRLSVWAGFEFSSGITINSVAPEKAAEWYRE